MGKCLRTRQECWHWSDIAGCGLKYCRILEPEASNQQVTEPLQDKGLADSGSEIASNKQVKTCKQACQWNTIYGCMKPESEPCILSNMPCERMESRPKTNADRIRSMTDEELTEVLDGYGAYSVCDLVCGGKCYAIASLGKTASQKCREIILAKLREPYKEKEYGQTIGTDAEA